MAAILEDLENQALRLSPKERSELIHRLIVSLDGSPEESPETIAKAWDEEITRRVADISADYVQKQNQTRQEKLHNADMVAQAWNHFNEQYGSFADEHSTL